MPVSPESLWTQAAAMQRAGRLEEAAAVYRRFIALRPDVVEARINLANLLSATGAHADAEALYRQASALRDLPEARFGLANALRAQGRLEEAVAAYRALLTLNASNPAAFGRERPVAALSKQENHLRDPRSQKGLAKFCGEPPCRARQQHLEHSIYLHFPYGIRSRLVFFISN
jgi:tetratricopeptide (TPR) repeat protein